MLLDLCDAFVTRADLVWLEAEADSLCPETTDERKALVDCLMLSLYWDELMLALQ